jgi:hypothetical protein
MQRLKLGQPPERLLLCSPSSIRRAVQSSLMPRFFYLIAFFYIGCSAVAQSSDTYVKSGGTSDVLQNNALWNAPCPGQLKSLKEMASSFRASRLPLASQITGTWVEIGFVYLDLDPQHKVEHALLNCAGLTREGKFELVLVADGYLVKQRGVGKPDSRTSMVQDHNRSVELDIDEGADEGAEKYRCRITPRGTLLCLDTYSGEEFQKMAVKKSQIYQLP